MFPESNSLDRRAMSTKSVANYRVFLEEEEEEEEYEEEEEESDIWEGFTILKRSGSWVSSKCSTCNNKRSSSLWESLDLLDKPQTGTGTDVDSARRALAMHIVTSGDSLSLVEGFGFQRFLRAANPQLHFSRSVVDRDIMDLYGREKDSLHLIMSEAPGRISFAVDHWKGKEIGDNYNDDIYVCITACFIDSNWQLQRRIVGFKLLTFPKHAPSIVDTVVSCLNELKVHEKVLCITLDNALHDASLADSFKTTLRDKHKLLCGGELCQVHCCIDILNSVVQAGLELIGDIFDKIRGGIHHITHSRDRKDEFYDYAKEVCHLDVTLKLRADLVVFWDSIYKMLKCALYYKEALKHFSSIDGTFLSNFHLSDEEWKKVGTMEKFLKPFYDIACTFLSAKQKTSSLYFLGIYKVYRLLEVTKEQDNFMAVMVKGMKVRFDKYWSEYSLVLACAAVLDPRYKLNLIHYCFRKIYGDVDGSQYTDKVVTLLNTLFTEYEKSSSCSAVLGGSIVEYHSKDDLFDDYNLPEQKRELDWYLESPAVHLNIDLDILEFWSGMSTCCLNIANLARDILAIPISTVTSSKSVFTMGEKVVSPRRSALRKDLLEMLICLHDWTSPKDKMGIDVSAIEGYIADDLEEDYCSESSDEEDDDAMEESDDGDSGDNE